MSTLFDLGVIEGLGRAAKMCDDKAKVHAEYLPTPTWQHTQLVTGVDRMDKFTLDLAATCGRRDECTNLSHEIRAAASERMKGVA